MTEETTLIDMTADIVSAFVSNNTVRPTELPELIATVHVALAGLTAPKPTEEPAPELKPAVPIKKSITNDHLISLEDGRKFKSLKRYLAGLGMTPDDYRAKWGLPRDYPMVAPGYAAKRSELAKAIGLGASRRTPVAANAPDSAPEPESMDEPTDAAPAGAEAGDAPAEAPSKRRGRPKKAA